MTKDVHNNRFAIVLTIFLAWIATLAVLALTSSELPPTVQVDPAAQARPG